MKTKTIGALILGLVASIAVGGGPAGADSSISPVIIDPAGDANFVNTQGNVTSFGMSTPGSIPGADIRSIWFETDYDRVRETDAATGSPVKVKHVPTALELNIKTEAPPIPSFGPTLVYRVQTQIGRCNVNFEAVVRGPQSQTQDPAQQARIIKTFDSTGTVPPPFRPIPGACPGGTGTITNPAFSLTSQGNTLTMRFPFSALPYSSTQLVLAPDVVIKPQPQVLGTLTRDVCTVGVVVCVNNLPTGISVGPFTVVLPSDFRGEVDQLCAEVSQLQPICDAIPRTLTAGPVIVPVPPEVRAPLEQACAEQPDLQPVCDSIPDSVGAGPVSVTLPSDARDELEAACAEEPALQPVCDAAPWVIVIPQVSFPLFPVTIPNYQSHNPSVKLHAAGLSPTVNGYRPVDQPALDETYPYQGRFRIGSDVPADIDCTVVPTPTECAA